MAHVLLNQRSWPLNCSSCHHLRWWCIILNSLDHIRSWCMLLYNYNRCFSAGRYYIVSWCMILYNCNLCYSASRYSYVQPLCRLCTQSFKLQITYHDPQKHIGWSSIVKGSNDHSRTWWVGRHGFFTLRSMTRKCNKRVFYPAWVHRTYMTASFLPIHLSYTRIQLT